MFFNVDVSDLYIVHYVAIAIICIWMGEEGPRKLASKGKPVQVQLDGGYIGLFLFWLASMVLWAMVVELIDFTIWGIFLYYFLISLSAVSTAYGHKTLLSSKGVELADKEKKELMTRQKKATGIFLLCVVAMLVVAYLVHTGQLAM